MKPWKSYVMFGDGGGTTMLQWGHGDEAVEEAETRSRALVHGPRLQWGHGDEAVEEHPTQDLRHAPGIASMGPRR